MTIQAVERALDVLLLFAERPPGSGEELPGFGVTQIAERLGLAKSTVHRILATLESRGFVRQDPVTGRYQLGLKALELAGAYLAQDDLGAVAYPEMVRLRDEVEETVSLYVRDGIERVRVQKAEGRQVVRRVANLGERLPLHRGASGKVLLAWLPPAQLDQILHRIWQQTPFDVEALKQELAEVRERGWATSAEERAEGVASVAAPIRNRAGEVVAALAISGPVQRFDDAAIERYSRAVVAAAHTIGMRL
ncbi:MAG: IclR family transcriptional regulator [Firmicutes bacterium]|nr:IclR family transcriptional regulator [Bacillota bacterium]